MLWARAAPARLHQVSSLVTVTLILLYSLRTIGTMTPNIYRFICGSIAFTGLQGLANAATLSPLHYLTGRSVPDGVLVAPLTRIENNSAYGLECRGSSLERDFWQRS